MRQNQGFSLIEFMIELMIALAIIVVFLAIIGGGGGIGCQSPSDRQGSAERNAKDFADNMGIEYRGLSCSGSDSDADGYVSCTFNLRNGQIQSFECGYDQPGALLGQNTGCKERMLKVVTPGMQQ